MISAEAFAKAAQRIGCEVAAIRAVDKVESRGEGFDPEGFPRTLFEAHVFGRLTAHKYDNSHPHLSTRGWDRSLYGKDWKTEKARLTEASRLNREAALQSASWGRFQIMGFNWGSCGFDSLQAFVNAMCAGEEQQLHAFVGFILHEDLDRYLKIHDWAGFARRYNGPKYAENHYDMKLAAAYEECKKLT